MEEESGLFIPDLFIFQIDSFHNCKNITKSFGCFVKVDLKMAICYLLAGYCHKTESQEIAKVFAENLKTNLE